jgi:membrane protein DedA with SNARE-associated domain
MFLVSSLLEFFRHFIVALQSDQLPQLGSWTYLLLAVLVAFEGPFATLLGASAASAGLMNPWLVFLAAAMGNLTADLLWYTVGFLGRIEWLFHFGKRLGLRRGLLEKLRTDMHEHAVKVLFLAKLTVTFVIPSLVTAGLLRLPLKRWFPPFVAAETIWTGSLVLIGFYTVEAIKHVERGVEYVILFFTVLLVLFLIRTGRRLINEWDPDKKETVSDHH